MKRFVIGDIHGAHRAMVQCFERSGFNKQEDLLICLGDYCDGWPEVGNVFNELTGIRNLVMLLGNHDQWLLNYFLTGDAPEIWLIQGGNDTIKSFGKDIPSAYVDLLKSARLYYILDNMLFVHGGFLPEIPIELQQKEVLLWDRSLVKAALLQRQAGKDVKITQFDNVYVGHTPTLNFRRNEPISSCGIILMDTGAGWPGGVLTMMDIDSKTFCQSEPVELLYPEFRGRK